MVNYSDLYNLDKKASEGREQDKTKSATSERPNARTIGRSVARTVERSSERTPERQTDPSPQPKAKRRQARRYSFEIFEDQIERIKRIALRDQLSGGELNQSVIARNALDRYLPELEAELEESQ